MIARVRNKGDGDLEHGFGTRRLETNAFTTFHAITGKCQQKGVIVADVTSYLQFRTLL